MGLSSSAGSQMIFLQPMSNNNTFSGNNRPLPEYFGQELVPEQGSCRELCIYQLVHSRVDSYSNSGSILVRRIWSIGSNPAKPTGI